MPNNESNGWYLDELMTEDLFLSDEEGAEEYERGQYVETCQGCGRGFEMKDAVQLCWSCKRK